MLLLPQQLVLAMVCLLSSVNVSSSYTMEDLLLFQISIQMEYILYIRVHSYSNNDTCPTCFVHINNQTAPGCCDEYCVYGVECLGAEKCDPRYFYCLRKFGTPVSLNATNFDSCGDNDRYSMSSKPNFNGRALDFTQDSLLGIPNPVPLNGLTEGWQVCMQHAHMDYTLHHFFIYRVYNYLWESSIMTLIN